MIRQLIREMLLREEVFGKLAFVYTGSHSQPWDVKTESGIIPGFIPMIVNDDLQPGKGKGGLYGKGLYTVYDLPGTQTESGFYGNYIYKLAINLYGYLCFDMPVATKVYGRPMPVVEQAEMLELDDDVVEKIRIIMSDPAVVGKRTAVGAQQVSLLVRGIVKGLVFTGDHDGQVAVVYDAATVTPVAHRTTRAKLWKKVSKDIRKQTVGRAQAPWRKERYEVNTFEKFKRVKAKLAKFKSLGESPSPEDLIIDGDLDLSGGMSMGLKAGEAGGGVTDIPAGLHVKGTLVIHPSTTDLPRGLKVDGNLPLYGTQVSEIPDGLVVGRNLMLSPLVTRIGSDVKVGSLTGGSTTMTELPPDMQIAGNIDLGGSQITKLPDNLTVNGNLNLRETPIRDLPAGLYVKGSLDLDKTNVEVLPDDLQVDDSIKLSSSFKRYNIPNHLLNGRRKDGMKKVWY